ncbi:unnamed protein product [Miscanthus lutarioriparius]|uniref:Enoyl reductase (ER) domain-containing protein n=1 Tax=Miscanthus lutarioriparius TaxID=422564 RepID=A0A811S4W6_9POAL|nr:unnamed protein product [Miscanthus lutarioriparius]
MEVVNRYVATRHHIVGAPTEADFEVKEETARWAPDSGEVIVRNLYLSIDPYQLNRMKRISASHLAVDSILPAQRIAAYAAGEVVASACEEYKAGDVVAGVLGWEDYTLFKPSPAVLMSKVADAADAGFPLSHHISVLGTSGMTAYGGLFEVGKPVKGEKVFVSAASGSVGSLVGQFAKIAGCYVVGCAGTQAKVDLLKNKLGFDDAFNYKEEPDLKSALKRYFPDGIDVYFENVGGEMLEAALANMNTYGRVALSGVIAEYTGGGRRRGAGPAGRDLQAHHHPGLLRLGLPAQVRRVQRHHRRLDQGGQGQGGRGRVRRTRERPVGVRRALPRPERWQEAR